MDQNTNLPYKKDAKVLLETGEDKFETLQSAIDKSGFIEILEQAYNNSGQQREKFLIAIKPNLMTASIKQTPSPVYTDPELMEFLIDKIYENGFKNIAVVEARNVYNYSYTGRTVKAVADLVGYSYKNFRVEDLSEQKIPFNYGSKLKDHFVGKTWHDADFRISFAKNKTHWQCLYTGCLKNVYGCLPEWDKMKHYHGKSIEFYEACILIADRFPVHFGFLDAWVSGDGFSGHVRDADPNFTKTIFASENILALDWVMGEKMNINPAHNYVIQEAMHRWGSINITRIGNMTPWYPWTNVRPFTVAMLDAIEEFYWLSRFFSRAFASSMDSRFKPVSKWQWLFSVFQFVSRMFEKLFEKKSKQERG